jgi:hypothetical protein
MVDDTLPEHPGSLGWLMPVEFQEHGWKYCPTLGIPVDGSTPCCDVGADHPGLRWTGVRDGDIAFVLIDPTAEVEQLVRSTARPIRPGGGTWAVYRR